MAHEVMSALSEAGGILVFITLILVSTYLVGVIERFGRRHHTPHVPTRVEDEHVKNEGHVTVTRPANWKETS